MDIERLQKPLLYQVAGMDQVVVQRNLVYKEEGDTQLQMDVYTPPDLPAEARLPGVIFIHGGPIPEFLPLDPKDWGVYRSYGALSAASGFVGLTFNHRFFSPTALEQAAGDIDAAVAYIRDRCDAFHLDPERLCVWAFSGGGDFLGPFLHDRLSYVRCLVSYYAFLDLRHLEVAEALSEEVVNRFSPVMALQNGGGLFPPILIARAGQDFPELNHTVDQFIHAAFAANVTLDLLNHPLGQHGFDILDDHPRTHEIIERTMAFIKTHT